MYSDRYEQRPWRDTMQVCLNGHVINSSYQNHPQYNKDYCSACGAATVTQCPSCENPIPGEIQNTGVVVIGLQPEAPEFCQHCGKQFPWVVVRKTKSQERKELEAIEEIRNVFSKFHRVARALRKRHAGRSTLDVADEYDAQDLLNSLLRVYFDDVRTEEWTPSYAWKML